ncbi:MAG TPA: PH domain-containing protein [Bryobacteraceae bacterium]|nr:PH domain-containing protein [Bryobacteraceae bacterium]
MTPIPAKLEGITRPVESLMTYYVCQALTTLPAFPITLLVLFFRYHTMRYQFSNEGIRMSWGIIFRNEVMLNYARIQDIHLKSNAVERYLGLARIEIQTASGSSNSVMTLEGIADAPGMRDFLYSRMRGAADTHHEQVASLDSPAGLAIALHEVAGELRAVRLALESRNKEFHR